MDIILIFTILFVLSTSILFYISYNKYVKRLNYNYDKSFSLDKSIYIIVPILIGLVGASLFCLIYVLI
jgi:hypothetical protein